MKSKLLSLFIVAACLSVSFFSGGVTKKVLFIGNSYTFTNNMPGMLDSIAAAEGDTLIWDMSAPGGFTLQQHCTNTTTIAKIFLQHWDVVVIHEQSEMPAFPPAQVATDTYPYATRLDSMVHANDSCTQTMFLMTWGHANGDVPNCGTYPVICTFDGMQERLRESYIQMGIDNHACVAPVGNAFKIMVDSMYTPWLYNPDSSHPIVPGSYLEASVLYNSIFHKTNYNCTYTAGVAATDAHLLQRIANQVVFDSLYQWQHPGHYPYAGFKHATAGAAVTFTNASPIAAQHVWSFGDTHTDTAANPVHTYTSTGVYTVTHTISNSCFSETLTDTVHITVTTHNTGVTTHNTTSSIIFAAQGNGNIALNIPEIFATVEILNANGQSVRSYSTNGNLVTDKLVPGFYMYRAYSQDKVVVEMGKMVVY